MSQQQYFKTNNGSGSGSPSNQGNTSNRDNLKNLMKKQQMNMNYIDNSFMQENMNRTLGLGSSNNLAPQGSNYQSNNTGISQNYSSQKASQNSNQQQASAVNKMIEAYQKNRPIISQQFQQYQQQSPSNQSNNYQSSPLRSNYNNLSVNQNMNSPTSRAATAQDSHRESNNYNNITNMEQLERKSSLGRNKIESSDAVNSSFGKIVSSNNQQKSSTNKVQQMLKDLMGNNQTTEKNSYGQYQLQNSYSKQNLNRTDNIGNSSSNQNYMQNYQNNGSRNEVSSLRSRENSNDRNKQSNTNTSINNLTQNNTYSNQYNNNQSNSKHQSLSPFQGTMGRQNSGSLYPNNINSSANQNNTSFNQNMSYKNVGTIEISNFNNSNNNDSYSQKLLKSSSSSKNLQLNDYDSKINKQSGIVTKGKTPSSQVQVQNNQVSQSSTLNKNSSNSKLRLQDEIIEQVYKSNRSVTPKYTSQQNQSNFVNKGQNNNTSVAQQRNKTPINSSQNQISQKTLNDTFYQQIVGNSAVKSPLSNSNNNNTSFSNANNSSFNQANAISASTNNLKISQQNSLPIDLQNRRLTPTPLNQNLEMFERHQSLQNIIQKQDQQYVNQQYQQQQNKSPLRTNNYTQQQPQSSVSQSNNSAKENMSSISNNTNKSPSSSQNNNNNMSYQNNQQRDSSKSPATSNRNTNTFGQSYNQQPQIYQQSPSQQLLNSKQLQQNLQNTQPTRGSSQEGKYNLQQQMLNQQQKNIFPKNKQPNNSANISAGVSQSSTSSTSSNQKSIELNKSTNTVQNIKQNNQSQQNLTQKLFQNQQMQIKEQMNSPSQSPFFGNQNAPSGNPSNTSPNLKKINTQNQNDLLKAIQEQIKLKNDRKLDAQEQPRKQKNKISQDFLDSTYFQFNTQLIEQIQQEQIEGHKDCTQNNTQIDSTAALLKESLYLTSLKQEVQTSQNTLPSFGQFQQGSPQNQFQQVQTQILQQTQQQQQQPLMQNQPKQSQQQQSQINQQISQNNQINKQQNNNNQLQKETLQQQQKQNTPAQQYLQKQTQSQSSVEEDNSKQINQQTLKKNQQQLQNEKVTLALNNDQESVDSASTAACFSQELSKSTLAKINLSELLQIEQNLYDLQKHGFKNKKQTTKYCKNYLNSIAEQNVDNLERICSDNRQSTILNRMFILERICVMLSLHESLNNNSDTESQCDNDDDDDDDDHIKNTLQYIHLNFFVFLDTVFSKFNFTDTTKQLEQQIKKVFETRTKVKRFASCLNKQDKFQVISNYCDIILPYLKNFVHNHDKEPYSTIELILNNFSIQTVSGTMSILMDCFSKIISDLEEKAIRDSKSSIDDSFSDLPTKQDVSTEKSKSNSVNSTTEKQKSTDEPVQKQNQATEQKQKSQQDTNTQQNQNKQENLQKQIEKDYYSQLEDDEEDEDDEDEFDADRQIGTIPAPYLPPLDNGKKYTLVLDLDETLVHYQETPDDGGQFLIRPNAEIFLQKLAQYYEIVIFTAAVKDYADFILNVIDSSNCISHRLYRQHTDRDGKSFVKDISKLGRDLSKTLIIDNLPENFSRQPTNGVLIQSWYGEADDRALYDLIPLLIDVQQSKKFTDVRIALQKLREQTMKNLLNGISDPHLNINLDKID